MFKKFFTRSKVALAILASSIGANAAQVTAVGTNLTYSYDSSTLFGTGTLIGDNLFFSFENFVAQSSNGAGTVLTTDTLNITITVNPGSSFTIDSIGLFESGDYIVNGDSAFVSASARTQVTSLTSSANPTSIELEQTGLLTSPNDGSTSLWSFSNVNDLSWEGETGVIYQIQNNLLAATTSDEALAFIQKNSGSVRVEVNPVPIPAAGWLFGSAIAVFGLWSRKKNR